MLAGFQRGLAHFKVLVGTGEVQYHFHFGIGKGVVHGFINSGHAPLLLRLFRTLAHQVAHADQFDLLERFMDILEIDAADIAHADHDGFDGLHILFLLKTNDDVLP